MKAFNPNGWRWTVFIACLILASPSWAARLALVIGNDNYQKVEPLKNARNDARLMAGILQRAGFDVTQASDLNRESLWATIDTFKGRINKGDEVVFYFAGHGVQIGANQLLLPTDIEARNDTQVQRDGVPLIDVQDALKDARVAVLLLDACRDNPFPKAGTRAIGGTRGLSPPDPSTGQIIMMSAGRNQKALDRVPGEAQPNGLFTWELSQVLQTPGLEIRAALEQVKERVDDKARKAGHEQRPSLVNDLRGNFYLQASVKPEPNPAYRPPLAAPAQGGGLNLDDLKREEENRKAWAQWQARMKADYDKTAAFEGSADLQAKAWERFLAAWGQDNPVSGEDEGLRAQAQGRIQERQQAAAEPILIKIGHVGPSSGGIAHLGKDNEMGARMAIDELNATGMQIGGRRTNFKLLLEDDAADPRQGVAAAQRLVNAGVNGVIGHLNSGTSIPASAIYSEAGIPQISPSSTNPKYTRQGYKTTFRIVADDIQLGTVLGKYAVDNLKVRNIAVIDDRTAYGQYVADAFAKAVADAGGRVVAREFTNDRATDFNAILTTIKIKKPDLIFFGGMDSVAGPMLKQMKQLGIQTKFMGGDGICSSELPQLSGGTLPDT